MKAMTKEVKIMSVKIINVHATLKTSVYCKLMESSAYTWYLLYTNLLIGLKPWFLERKNAFFTTSKILLPFQSVVARVIGGYISKKYHSRTDKVHYQIGSLEKTAKF